MLKLGNKHLRIEIRVSRIRVVTLCKIAAASPRNSFVTQAVGFIITKPLARVNAKSCICAMCSLTLDWYHEI